MQRILIRFLLEKERESDEVGEGDFGELKQDLQMIRFEMLNELKQSREEMYRLTGHLNTGILLMGEEVFKNSKSDLINRYSFYKKKPIKGIEKLGFDSHEDDKNQKNKTDSIESLSSSIDTSSSSSNDISNDSSNTSLSTSIPESLNSNVANMSDVTIFTVSNTNEIKKQENKVSFNYDLDIIKEEDEDIFEKIKKF